MQENNAKDINYADFELQNFLPAIVYFYSKDNTSGCSVEAQEFAEKYPEIQELGFNLIGISRDKISSHQKFREKYNLPFYLIADTEENLCKQFDVLKEKTLYGKKHIGIVRSTFVLDKDGKIIQEWRNVKARGHAEIVMNFISEAMKK
ncbi:MAG: peroxiredoxin [Cardiobacteriaceae bacterium]|nr:peroxiredoxin [Cardiobacteriaceae bacterium]